MFFSFNIRKIIPCFFLVTALCMLSFHSAMVEKAMMPADYIKWVEFNVPASVMRMAMEADIKSQKTENKTSL